MLRKKRKAWKKPAGWNRLSNRQQRILKEAHEFGSVIIVVEEGGSAAKNRQGPRGTGYLRSARALQKSGHLKLIKVTEERDWDRYGNRLYYYDFVFAPA